MSSLQMRPTEDGLTIGGSEVITALVCYNSDSGYRTNNVMVDHFDLSLANSAAVVELSYGRLEPQSDLGSGNALFFRGSNPAIGQGGAMGRSSRLVTSALDFPTYFIHEICGRYYVKGGGQFQLKFSEPFEALHNPGGSASEAFAFMLKRLDSETPVSYHANVWFEEY